MKSFYFQTTDILYMLLFTKVRPKVSFLVVVNVKLILKTKKGGSLC